MDTELLDPHEHPFSAAAIKVADLAAHFQAREGVEEAGPSEELRQASENLVGELGLNDWAEDMIVTAVGLTEMVEPGTLLVQVVNMALTVGFEAARSLYRADELPSLAAVPDLPKQ